MAKKKTATKRNVRGKNGKGKGKTGIKSGLRRAFAVFLCNPFRDENELTVTAFATNHSVNRTTLYRMRENAEFQRILTEEINRGKARLLARVNRRLHQNIEKADAAEANKAMEIALKWNAQLIERRDTNISAKKSVADFIAGNDDDEGKNE